MQNTKEENLNNLRKSEREYFADTLRMWPRSSKEDRQKRLRETEKRIANRNGVLSRGFLSLRKEYLDFLLEEIQHLEALRNLLHRNPSDSSG